MPETITITLGGKSYAVRRFTLGQLRRLLAAEAKPAEFGFNAITIALERATPKPEGNVEDMEIDVAEFRDAVDAIAKFSGLKRMGEAPAGAPTV